MFIWRKRADPLWISVNEQVLSQDAGSKLAMIARPGCRGLVAEVAHNNSRFLERIRAQFGGAIERLPSDWRQRLHAPQRSKPLKIGQRLTICSSPRKPKANHRYLIIPAGAAFGTGEHATTAMCLRLLEQTTRCWNREWSMLDLGTGSGILALAGRMCGASEVVGLDRDPASISTAVQNARRNRVDRAQFVLGDATKFEFSTKFDVITANLFTGLLVKLLSRLARFLKPNGCAIVSGILRDQEREITGALKSSRLSPAIVRRRGKWVAMLVARKQTS